MKPRTRSASVPAVSIAAPPAPPRFAWLWAALTYLVCTMMLAWPALAGGFLVNPHSDQYIGGYPLRAFGAEVLRQTGGFPTWNPYLMGGVPFVAGMAGDIFYPTFLLRLVLPTDVAMTWSFIIHIFLAGLFTFGFLRACRFSFPASLVGGVAYMMGGNIAGFVSPGHDGKLYVATLLPLTLWMIVRGVRDGRAWAWGGLAIAVGLAVLSPHPQLLQYMLLTSGAFALYAAFAEWDGVRLDRGVAIRRLAFALGAVLLGAAIGAIQYVPVREYVAWSPRAGGRDYTYASSYSHPPEEMLDFYLPQFSGILDAYWGRTGIHFHSVYIGAAVLVLAGLAWGARARILSGHRFVAFWTGTLIVATLWVLGGYTPFYRLVYAIVPGSKFFRAPNTFLFVLSFSVAVLAAAGVERALRVGITRRYAIGWGVAALVIALLASVGGLTNLGSTFVESDYQDQLLRANAGAVVAGAWRSLLFVGLALGALLAVAQGKIPRRLAGWALAAVVAVDLWSVVRLYWLFSPPAAELYAADETIRYVKRQPQPGRVYTLPANGGQLAPHDPFLLGNGLMVHRVRSVLGYHGNELRRYQELYGKNLGEAQLQRVFGTPNFWRLTNMQYVLTNLGDLSIPGFERVVGPVKNAAGSTVYLYRVPGQNPAAWVTPAIVKLTDEQVLPTVLDQRFDVSRVALFDTSAAVTGKTLSALPEPLPITATVDTLEPGHIVVRLDRPAPAGAALVVSENYYPGWKATVDGRAATVGRTDYTLVGVELPEGARRVELRFDSPTYHRGKAITLVALVLALGLWVGGLVAGRFGRG